MLWVLLLGCPASPTDTEAARASHSETTPHSDTALDTETASDTAAEDTEPPTATRWEGRQVITEVAQRSWLGEGAGDRLGRTVAAAGDFDGDGQDDLVLGAYYQSEDYERNGKVYLFHGPVDAGDGDLGDAWLTVTGEMDTHFVSRSVAGVGDVDGDGDDELLIGAPTHNGGRGMSCLLRGGDTTGALTISEADVCLEGDNGLTGAFGTGPGDVDGDGLADVLVTAIFGSRGGPNGGEVFLVPGPLEDGVVALDDVAAQLLLGAEESQTGWFTDGAGDVDGDGYADYWLGAPAQMGAGSQEGAAYLVRGTAAPTAEATAAEVATLTLLGGPDDRVGASVAGGSDVTGDGQPDVAVGAWGDSSLAGGFYLYDATDGTGTVDLPDAADFYAGEVNTQAGWGIAMPGDLDGDGLGEVWVGAYAGEGTPAEGLAHLLYGPLSGGGLLEDADATFTGGETGDYLGWFLSGAGDVDGDGHPDLVVGAQRSDAAGTEAGRAHLLLAP